MVYLQYQNNYNPFILYASLPAPVINRLASHTAINSLSRLEHMKQRKGSVYNTQMSIVHIKEGFILISPRFSTKTYIQLINAWCQRQFQICFVDSCKGLKFILQLNQSVYLLFIV